MRFSIACLMVASMCAATSAQVAQQSQQDHARRAEELRRAREAAEAVVRYSGPVQAQVRQMPTPPQWNAPRPLASTWTDPAARERFVAPTPAWRWPYGWYGWSAGAWWCGPTVLRCW